MKNRGIRRLGLLASLVLAWAGLVIVVQPTAASAADPWVDSTFGTDGLVQRKVSGLLSGHVVGQAKAPNGDLVMAIEPAHTFYNCCLARVGRWSLARVSATGVPVASFGDGGVVQPALDAAPSSDAAIRLSDVAVDSSGRVLVVGARGQESTESPVVMRRTAAGALDTTYGSSGLATFAKPAVCQEAPILDTVVTHDSGKVTVAGSCYDATGTSLVLARFTAGGVLDTGFGSGGVRAIRVPAEVGCCGADLHRLTDGRLFVRVGVAPGAVVRTSATGAPDSTFGTGGVVVLGDAADWYGGAAMLVAPDGSFLVDGKNDFSDWVVKYSAQGVRDEAYGAGEGKGTFALPDECSNPRLVDLAGTVANPVALTACEEHSVLSALTADGSPDATYGIETTTVRPSAAVGQLDGMGSMLLTDGTGLLVAGATVDFPVRVERRLPDGALDSGYGTAGGTELDITGRLFDLEGGSSAVDAQGRILTAVVADNRVFQDEDAILVSRFLPGGGTDTSFGQGGTATVEAGGHSPGKAEEVHRPQVIANTDGTVSVVARWKNENFEDEAFEYGFLTARLTSNGSPDTATIPGGTRVAKIPDMIESRESGGGIAPTPGGTLVALETLTGSAYHPAVAKLLPSGALDTSFGVGGVRALPDETFQNYVDLHPGTNGSALLTWGAWGAGDDVDYVAARVTSAGVVDGSYGTDGRFRRAGQADVLTAASTPSGELVYGWGIGRDVKLRRVTAGGTADLTFGTSGVATLAGPSGTEAWGLDLHATSSGIEVGFEAGGSPSQAMLGRLTNAGAPVGDFGAGGVARAFAFPAQEGSEELWITPLPGGATALATLSAGPLSGEPKQLRLTKLKPSGGGTTTQPKLTGPAGTVVTTSAAYSWTGLSAPYTVETSTAPSSGGFGSWQAGSPTSQSSVSLPLNAGTSTCVRVRSGDQVTPTSCVTSPLMSTSMTSTKTWKKLTASGYYRGTARKATARGASLSSTVTAGGLDLVASRCGSCGSVNVFWNGTKVKSISLKGTAKKRLVVPIVTWPDVRTGQVKLKVSTSSKPVIIEGLATRRNDVP